MIDILFKTDETLGDIYYSPWTARMAYNVSSSFLDFLDECIERFKKGEADGTFDLSDDEGIIPVKEGIERRAYKYMDMGIVLEKGFDRCMFFIGSKPGEILDFEEEQADLMTIDENFDELRDRALEIATKAHEGQVDKAGAPYIEHPIHISEHVEGKAEKIVALLHDVIEDSDMRLEDLHEFPRLIVDAVSYITKGPGMSYPNYIVRVLNNNIACNVKIEDMKHNMDLSRLETVTAADEARNARYEIYLKLLEDIYTHAPIALGDPPSEVRMVEYQFPSYDFHRAMDILRDIDETRLRKAMEAVYLLMEMEAPEHVVLAGLFYNAVYMESENMAGVARNFGDWVYDTYMHLPWNFDFPLEDKGMMIEDFLRSEEATRDRKLVMLATAITELRKWEFSGNICGKDNVFSDPEEKLEYEQYFNSYLDGFEEFEHDEQFRKHYWMLQNIYKDVFISYHISNDFRTLYQGGALFCYRFTRGEHGWEKVQIRNFPKGEFSEVTREEAETLEDDWVEELMEMDERPVS